MDTTPWQSAIRIGRNQAGVIHRRQLRHLGMTSEKVRTRVGRGDLEMTLPGVWRFSVVGASPLQHLWSAALWADGAVVCGRSAGQLWNLDRVATSRPEVMVASRCNPRHPSVIVRRASAISLADVRRLHGLRITNPDLTLVHLAGTLAERDLEIAFESARRQRLATVDSVAQTLDRVGSSGRIGVARLQTVLHDLNSTAACESVLEVDTARLLRRNRIATPTRQHEVRAFSKVYRLDFAWPSRRVFLECFGREPHDDPARWAADYDRLSAIAATTGWTPLVTTWNEVHHTPLLLIAKVRTALARGHELPEV